MLRVIRWGISAWENDVTPATIQNCWARSQAVNFGQFPLLPSDLWTESQEVIGLIRQGIYSMRGKGYLVDVPNMREYISLYAEIVADDSPPGDLVDDIVANYTQAEVDEEEEDMIVEPVPAISHEEALQALHTLQRYEEENQYGDVDLLKLLRSHERDISLRYANSRQQVRLNRWFISSRGGELEGFQGAK